MKSGRDKIKLTGLAILHLVWLFVASGNTQAQVRTIPQLHPKLEVLATPQSTAGWIDFRAGTLVNPSTVFIDLRDAFELKDADQVKIAKTAKDKLGFTHFRYQQFYKNLKVVYGEYALHQQPDGFVKSANGRLIKGLKLGNIPLFSQKNALYAALQFMNAGKYLWQNVIMENELKRQENNVNATYYPNGELVYAPSKPENLEAADYKLAWQFKIYTDDPTVAAKLVYVDALTGRVIHYTDISMTCSGSSGTSAFNGNVTFNTRAGALNLFNLSHNDCQATDLYVYNCNGGAAANNLYSAAGNAWTDRSGVQAQWGVAMVYNYYSAQHSRQGWDGSGGDLIAYNNAYAGSNNACWGCTGNQAIFYAGSTAAATDDWNPNDIVAHEFTHGVTQDEAGLMYYGESGALNESFSDIFGEMVESWSESNCDYLVGADRGAIRSFINPNTFGDPDTYLGTNWYSGTGDNAGVHTNSGVQNHWFYLLSEGGTGTNDLGQSYKVKGIGRFAARVIAYRALTLYLNSSSKYIDARAATLHAAWDLYGKCSTEIIAVGDAWHAVGVESQSAQFVNEACGTYSAGTLVQAISQLNAAQDCAVTVNSATDVYFVARDRVILHPGFKAVSGSKFVAYLEPCSATMWKSGAPDANIIMSDAEKGIKPISMPVTSAETSPDNFSTGAVSISPNPFHSTFEVSIRWKQDTKGSVYVFNTLGEKVKVIPVINVVKGFNKITFNGASFKSGIYMVEIRLGNEKMIKKIVKL